MPEPLSRIPWTLPLRPHTVRPAAWRAQHRAQAVALYRRKRVRQASRSAADAMLRLYGRPLAASAIEHWASVAAKTPVTRTPDTHA